MNLSPDQEPVKIKKCRKKVKGYPWDSKETKRRAKKRRKNLKLQSHNKSQHEDEGPPFLTLATADPTRSERREMIKDWTVAQSFYSEPDVEDDDDHVEDPDKSTAYQDHALTKVEPVNCKTETDDYIIQSVDEKCFAYHDVIGEIV